MTPEERSFLNQLCFLIAEEKDPNRFLELVRELNNLLDGAEKTPDPIIRRMR